MPHKYVTSETIKNLEMEIAFCDSSIQRLKAIRAGGSEGMKELALQVRDLMESARAKKDTALDLLMQNGAGVPADPLLQEKASLLCRGQEKMAEIIIEILENPENAIRFYQAQKESHGADLAKYKANEVRLAS